MSFYLTHTQNINNRSVDSLLIYKEHTIFKLVNNEYISLFNDIGDIYLAISLIEEYIEKNNIYSLEVVLKDIIDNRKLEILLINISEYLSNNDLSIGLIVEDKSFISFNVGLLDKYGVMHVKERRDDFKEIRSYKKINKSYFDSDLAGSSLSFVTANEIGHKKNPAKPKQNRKNILDPDISLDTSFLDLLYVFLRESNKDNIEVYKKAGITRQVFSKILCNKDFIPKKETIICLIIGLELTLSDANKLLNSAGYTLSSSLLFDSVIIKFLKKEIYDLDKINEELDKYDLPLLGWKPRE